MRYTKIERRYQGAWKRPGDGNGIPFSFGCRVWLEDVHKHLAKCVRNGKLSAKLSDEAARAEKTKKPASSKERMLLNCFQYAKNN